MYSATKQTSSIITYILQLSFKHETSLGHWITSIDRKWAWQLAPELTPTAQTDQAL